MATLRRTLRPRLAAALVAALACAPLAACGDDSGEADDPSATSSSSVSDSPSTDATKDGGLPECADVWVDGQDLPTDYTACTTDGQTVKPKKRMCGYGAALLEQEGRYYAMRGKPVRDAGDLKTDKDYQQLLAACQG